MFCFHPNLEHSCPNVQHCPHLGGAGLVSVVHVAKYSDQTREYSLRNIRVLERDNAELISLVVRLQNQLEQAKLELKLERQNKFATNKQKQDGDTTTTQEADQPAAESPAKKRGAPGGHPG